MNGEVPLLSKRRTFLFKKVSSLLERSHSVIHDEIYFHCLLNQLELPADLLCASLGIKYVRIWNLRKVGGKTTNKEHNTLRTERLVWIFPALFEERSRVAGAAAVPAMAARGRCAPAGRCGRCASRSAPESRGDPGALPEPRGIPERSRVPGEIPALRARERDNGSGNPSCWEQLDCGPLAPP